MRQPRPNQVIDLNDSDIQKFSGAINRVAEALEIQNDGNWYDSVKNGILYAKETNNWALGTHNHENKTFADYKAAIQECAEYCGVRTVDVGSICAANRYNMDSMLGDGIHPTEDYYKMMGYALAPFIK